MINIINQNKLLNLFKIEYGPLKSIQLLNNIHIKDNIYICKMSNKNFHYFKKFDCIKSFGLKNILHIIEVNKKNKTYKVNVLKGKPLKTSYTYYTNKII